MEFDLARRVRVFTSQFQFVELEMTGCYLSRKQVPIPPFLMGLAEEKEEIQRQFHAHFNLVSRMGPEVKVGNKVLTEQGLRKQKERIAARFLIPLKKFGNVVRRANKDALIQAVEALRAEVQQFGEGIRASLQTQMDQNANALVSALLPAVRRTPPMQYKKIHGPTISDPVLRELLGRDIKEAFGCAEDLVGEMTVSLVFKDVAYESLVDETFLEVARKAMPGLEGFHEEYEAARQRVEPEQPRLLGLSD